MGSWGTVGRGFWRGARRGASAASRATVEPLSAVLLRLVVPEATRGGTPGCPPRDRSLQLGPVGGELVDEAPPRPYDERSAAVDSRPLRPSSRGHGALVPVPRPAAPR